MLCDVGDPQPDPGAKRCETRDASFLDTESKMKQQTMNNKIQKRKQFANPLGKSFSKTPRSPAPSTPPARPAPAADMPLPTGTEIPPSPISLLPAPANCRPNHGTAQPPRGAPRDAAPCRAVAVHPLCDVRSFSACGTGHCCGTAGRCCHWAVWRAVGIFVILMAAGKILKVSHAWGRLHFTHQAWVRRRGNPICHVCSFSRGICHVLATQN